MILLLSKTLILLIRLYQLLISPLFPNTCRFYPSCSHYAIESISKFGPLKGFAYAVWRIWRCNPFNAGGYDPVR